MSSVRRLGSMFFVSGLIHLQACAAPVEAVPGAEEINEVSRALRVRCQAEYDSCRHASGALASAKARCEKQRQACDSGEAPSP